VRTEFRKISRTHKTSVVEDEPPLESFDAEVSVPPPSPHESWLVKLLFLQEELVNWCGAHLDLNWIQHPHVRQIVEKRIQAAENHSWTNLGAFLDECEAPELRSMITEAATQNREIPNAAQQLADVTLRLRNQFIDRQLASLSQRASQPELDDDQRLGLLREQQELRVLKRQPIAPPAP
jgi:hypothetical protein